MKVRFMTFILVSSIMAIFVLPLYAVFFLYPAFNSFLIKQSEAEAVRVASHCVSMFHSGKQVLDKDKLNQKFMTGIPMAVKDFHLMKLKVFNPGGEIIFSTESKDIGTINEKEYFHNVVARGETYT